METETQETKQENTEQQVPETAPLETLNLYDKTQYSAPNEPVEEPKTPVVPEEPKTPETPAPSVPEPTVQIKEVEKIIEKHPEFKDEFAKQIYQALSEGKTEEVYKYLSEKNRDYNTMSDVDVVKQNMKLANPSWSDRYIDVEFKTKYGTLGAKKDLSAIDKEVDPDEYERALAFNEDLDTKEILLNQAAIDARLVLEGNKQNLEFPKLTPTETHVAPAMTQDEIDELNRKWDAKVDAEMPNMSDFKFKVGDEEVVYKITDEDKAAQTAYMKTYDSEKMAEELGWVDANGDEVPLKIAEDLFKLRNIEKIIASTSTQMKTNATKEVIAEIKNLDLKPDATPETISSIDVGALLYGKTPRV